MRTPRVIGLYILILFSAACSEPDILSKVCPYDQPCTIRPDGQIVTGNVQTKGTCVVGRVTCDEDSNIVCADFVGPTEEICDGLDNDCDGFVDDGFDRDRDGYTSCGGDCDDGNGKINPDADEVCNNADDDCDGIVDKISEECWTHNGAVVFNEQSTCKKGTRECEEGRWKSCRDQTFPRAEVCDGMDNNCDGIVDEIVVDQCGPRSEEGICQRGDQVCTDNETQCVGAVYALSEELCDGLDNDCDGTVDEDLSRLCETECGYGEEVCTAGNWTGCNAPIPTEEICDDIDNDCDGELDEGCICSYLETQYCVGQGASPIINPVDGSTIACGLGVQVCDMNGEWGDCTFVGVGMEQCNNWDDDCDGTIDEIVLPCGDPTLAGIGECRLGTSTCSAGLWSDCEGAVAPLEEICDDKDNDCDGQTDEDLDPHDKVDILFVIDGSGSMCSAMNALRQGLSNYVSDFQGLDHKFGIMMFPGNAQGSAYDVVTVPPLTDINSFQNALANVACNRGGIEPSYDAMYAASSPTDPAGIGWRSDAYPYIVLITDEPAQTFTSITETNVALNCINCSIGSCVAGDSIETYVIIQGAQASQWDEVTYFEPERIIEILPADGNRYTDLLRGIFSNVCIQEKRCRVR